MSYPTEKEIEDWCRNVPGTGPERDALIARRATDRACPTATRAMSNPYRNALQEFHTAFMDKFFGNDSGLPTRLIKACNEAGEILHRTAPPAPPAEALAASCRSLLEEVARMGDCIGQHTVGEITAISDRAAAWLADNPPGQPVAIEPRGCPAPGACSCVEPPPPAEGEVGELVAALRDPYIAPLLRERTRAADLLAQCHPAPVPVSERLPEPNTKVLAHYFNALGNGRTVCAIWVPAKSRDDDVDFADDNFTEYDEEDDKYYWPEGWYEAIENWDEYGWIKVWEEVVYWQPLPKWPALPLPAGEVQP